MDLECGSSGVGFLIKFLHANAVDYSYFKPHEDLRSARGRFRNRGVTVLRVTPLGLSWC